MRKSTSGDAPGRARGWGRRWRTPGHVCLTLLVAAAGCGEGEPADGSARAELAALRGERERLDRTVWADEKLAQQHEQTIFALWDELLAAARRGDAGGQREALAGVAFDELALGTLQPAESLDHGIALQRFAGETTRLDPVGWRALLERLDDAGWELVQSEWHHARFEPGSGGAAARSKVSIALHAIDRSRGQRAVVEGPLDVEWSTRRDTRGNPIPARIDATGLRIWTRSDPPGFEHQLAYEWAAGDGPSRLHPVLLYDLDGDGLSEIVMLGASRVLWNRGDGRFEDAPLVRHGYSFAESGALGDLDGDGHVDLLATRVRGDLVLYRGSPGGRFEQPPIETPRFAEPLQGPSALALGDVDADGDLDVWLAQYKPAYRGGQMPTPYYDANDGYPSYLLLNDGDGRLTPATEAAGLAARRFRRTYASSFVDLDGDLDLDLLVVSDFSGVDLYRNDGAGHFTAADAWLRGDRHLFGMSAAFADYDLDGRLDFYVAGMASTTARRLEALGLGRDDRPDVQAMRMRMAFGNRMYLASDDGWREPAWRDQVARTGWTWGTTAFDFDNDGDPDLFAANGHVSGESSQDYCANFWTHDIYEGSSQGDPALASLFDEETRGLATGRESWDGHQKNHLLMNREGRGFANVAFEMGVADEFDTRSAVSDDLDHDGRVDLVVVEDRGSDGQRLHVYRNRLATGNHWIGVQLREDGSGVSPVGAQVVVRTPKRRFTGRIVTGETLMGQHSTSLHFGLGREEIVEAIEVRWVDGREASIAAPEVDRYHRVSTPPRP